jgi:formylglycine-generating enzyme required for sulfatase activity
MVLVPAGRFTMGTDDASVAEVTLELGLPESWAQDAHPAHIVELPAYWIDRFEVTNAQFAGFVATTGAAAPRHWTAAPAGTLERLPVVWVSWFQAEAYCRWLGKRLPTEAEWEKAARDGDARLYPWGNAFDRTRAAVGAYGLPLQPVGSFQNGQSAYGVMDLVGNAWEWTGEWYHAYPGSPFQSDDFGQQHRVVRGSALGGIGHFEPDDVDRIVAITARASFRWYAAPDSQFEDLGFRCARGVAP